jgi:hypothetical protein
MPYKDGETQKKAQQDWYQKNKVLTRDRSRAKRKTDREWLNGLKDNPCIGCGLSWPPCVMEFHHREAKDKVGSVGNLLLNAGRQKVIDEIAKCDLLCANCHRIKTYPSEREQV